MTAKKKTQAEQVKEAEKISQTFTHLASDGLGGFEGITNEIIAFPFIRILQTLSPQLNKRKPEYIAEAETGMLYNSINNNLYAPPIEIVVGKFERYFIEWKPDRKGFAGAHLPEDIEEMLLQGKLQKNGMQIVDPRTENTFADTYIYYIVFPESVEDGVCLLALSSTQLKEARRWNRLLLTTFIPGSNQRAQPYFMRWTVTTPIVSNDKGDWHGFKVDFAGFVTPEILQVVSNERKALPHKRPDLQLLESTTGEDVVDVDVSKY